MSLDTIMNLSITVESRAPAQAGFGTPLLFGYHTNWLDSLTKLYGSADEMLDDGFTADDALYKAAQIVKSQNPAPDTFYIGRRVAALTQVIELTPKVTTEGYKYKGTIGGKTFSYTVPSNATLSSVAAGMITAINALSAGTTAAGDSTAYVLGTIAGPWELANGDTLLVAVDGDVPGSPDTATFSATAASRESSSGTWDLSGGKTLLVSIDGGDVQTINFSDGNFATPAAATAAEVAAVLNGLVGASAAVTNTNKVTITSDRKGTGSGVNISGGTANAALLAFTTGNVAGTGNVSDITAVTFAEAQSIIEAATDATVTNSNGMLKLSSSTAGANSKVLVTSASTADSKFGIDNVTHTGAAGGNVVTCVADEPGVVIDFDWAATTAPKHLGMKDVTVDTTTDNELPLVNEEEGSWYGLLVVDSSSTATALNAAGWIETKRKLCVVQSGDTDCLDPNVVDDTMSALKDSSYARTGCIWHRGIGGAQWLAAGWLAGALTTTPGSATMAFKSVPGVKVDVLLPGEDAAVLAKNGSYYINVGLPNTFEGKSGAGEFMDTVRFIDWVYARMRETVIGVLSNNIKVPFTDTGVDMMRSAIGSVIQLGINAGGFAKDPPYTVTAPLVKDVPTANRINRILPDVNWTAQLAGAIHRMNPVRGRVSV